MRPMSNLMRPRSKRKRLIRPERLLLACLLCWAPFVQGDTPPPYVITPGFETASITVYSDYLLDPNGSLTLEDVISPSRSPRFVPAANDIERLGFSGDAWWTRVALRNETGEAGSWVLELAPGIFREFTLFTPTSDGYARKHAGMTAAAPWGDFRSRRLSFELDLPPGQTRVYYMRIVPERSFHYSLSVFTPEAFVEHTGDDPVFFWLLSGLILGLVIYNLSLFGINRDAVHLWYSVFLATLTLAALTPSGIVGFQYLHLAGIQAHLETSAILATLAANALFSRHFLSLADNMPRMDRVARYTAMGFWALTLLVWFMPNVLALQLAFVLTSITALAFLWLGIVCWQQDIEEAGLYILARSALTLVVLLAVAGEFGWLDLPVRFPPLLLLSTAFEATLFAVGLNSRKERELRSGLVLSQQAQLGQRIDEARRDTLARMSHEIRTPMSGIMGMAEILDDTPLSPNQKEYVRAIRGAGENLLQIVNDVLDYPDGGTSPGDVNRETFDLNRTVMEALDLFRERAEEKQIELITHIHTNVPNQVHGDRGRLRQVLTNLLACNIRHGKPGELVLDVARDPSGRTDHLRFEFAGSSLADAWTALSILENQEDQAAATRDNTALGLSIARQLVEGMDGRLQLRKDRHRQPVCLFSLPLPDAGPEPASSVDTGILNGRNMLVVDDSATVTRVIRQQALSWGMRVTVCHDPREALATIRTQANINDPFDVILLDHTMPGISGMQLATRIHEDPVLTHPMALIMLTGVQAAPSATTARNVGIHRILMKPVSGTQLRRAVAEELSQFRRNSEPDDTVPPDPGLRLLVAEDHQLSQKVIRGMLGKLGLDAELVGNGAEAVAAVKNKDYDLVFMDCEMPQMDGFEATRQIRAWEREHGKPAVPIVALTAHILREHRERSLASGMNDHVPKPVELDVLRQVIARFTNASDDTLRDSDHASDGTHE
jgi:CheY-like chemotaxis protein/signal transduction histidine kinase